MRTISLHVSELPGNPLSSWTKDIIRLLEGQFSLSSKPNVVLEGGEQTLNVKRRFISAVLLYIKTWTVIVPVKATNKGKEEHTKIK